MTVKRKPLYGRAANGELFATFNKRRQGCCGKISYSSEATARTARDNMARLNPQDTVGFYQCRRGSWHLTTHPR